MGLPKFLKPKPTISDNDLSTGLHWLTVEGTLSLGFYSITTSGFLAAFALALGASSFHIGVLAAIPFLMHTLQIPAIWLVEKFRRRKAMAVISWAIAQAFWIPIALIPVMIQVPSGTAISMLLVLMAIRGVFHASTNCAWTSWIKDLVPQSILGRFFSRRLAFANATGMAFSLGAALFIDHWLRNASTETTIFGYTYVLLFGAIFMGMASPLFMSRMPEPLMQPFLGKQPSLKERLSEPLRDKNFRRLLIFLFSWSFSSNLAIPFFAVYMLVRLGLPLTLVIVLSIIGQLFNILFLRVWGRFVDRFGNKVVLSICASLYLLVIVSWIFTTMPEKYFLTVPLLFLLHIFAGIANAGVTLNIGTIGLKMAPSGEATPYLAGASLATNLGSGLGPFVGGVLAGFFAQRQLNLIFTWIEPTGTFQLSTLSIAGYDFLFVIAFFIGLATLSLLATIREQGEVSREVAFESLLYPTRELSRPISSVPSYNLLSSFPLGYLRKVPVPGLDAALGVTAYQIAEMSRMATTLAVRGHKVTRKLNQSLKNGFTRIGRSREEVKTQGVDITREVARGAVHVLDEKPVDIEQLVESVVTSVVETSSRAGADAQDAIFGTSQGVIQGAAETEADLGTVTHQTIEAAKEVAAKMKLPEHAVLAKVAEGVLQAAEAIGPEAVAEVVESLPEEILPTANEGA